jgi:hypothetical protein
MNFNYITVEFKNKTKACYTYPTSMDVGYIAHDLARFTQSSVGIIDRFNIKIDEHNAFGVMGVDMYFKRLHAVYGCHNQGVERVGR